MSADHAVDRSNDDGTTTRVAIVILSWNQRDNTVKCLDSLAKAGYATDHVIVWDNGSTDGTVETLTAEFPAVKLGRSDQNLGVASGRNAAARLAVELLAPRYILFLDNDMLVTKGFVEALVGPFAGNDKLAQTTAKILTMNEPRRVNAAGGSHVNFVTGTIAPIGFGEVDGGQFDTARECLPGGGGTMVRADVFSLLAGFDTVFDPYGPEDLDFSFRVRKAGYRAAYVPEAVVYHDHHRSVNEGEFSENYASNKTHHWMILLRRHATPAQKAGFFLIGAPLGAVRVALRELLRGNSGAIKGMLTGMWRHLADRSNR
jgi:GT2 family glycosyltransferase